jgi:predicted O-methyltransferase YrrM
MTELWSSVDRYLTDTFVPYDPVLEAALRDSREAGLPTINVTPNQGKLLALIVQVCGARRILEVGTLGGYSTIWMARALPIGGRLVTLELEPAYAAVASRNLERANLSDVVDIRVGPAAESLAKLEAGNADPFDFVFIDANKECTDDYFLRALKLSRPGTVIIVDNVVRDGAVVDAESEDPSIQGIRRFNELAANEKRVSATAIQTVGSKGYDGFAMVRVIE